MSRLKNEENLNVNFPDFKIGDDVSTETESSTLFETTNFKIFLARDNQKVPGILEVIPTNPKLTSWKDLQIEDHIELNKIQRLCEFLLIKTFHSHADNFSMDDEKKILINSYAREFKDIDGTMQFKLKIYPRYANGQIITISPQENNPIISSSTDDLVLPENTVSLSDPSPGKPFEYINPTILPNKTYSIIVDFLRKNLLEYKEENIKFNFPTNLNNNHEKCFNCTHPKNHVDNAGLMQISIVINQKEYQFNLALDARDQTNVGRGYIIPVNHDSALRYTDDMTIALLHKIGDAYQRAAEKVFNRVRTFDRAVLMNLYKEEEGGPHVHLHMVPREESINYQLEYPMLAKDYTPLTKDPVEKKKIVDTFSQALFSEINKDPVLKELEIEFSYLSFNKSTTPVYSDLTGTLFSPRDNKHIDEVIPVTGSNCTQVDPQSSNFLGSN